MENKSGIGDWLFVVVGLALLIGVLAYDNQAAVMSYIESFQSITAVAQPEAQTASLLDNWGLIALVIAVAFAIGNEIIGKRRGDTIQRDDGETAQYESHKYVDVKVVR